MPGRVLEVKKRGTKDRKIKPVYLIVAEGRNKTETLYLSNFQEQGRPYSIRFVKAGNNTDAESLYEVLLLRWEELGLSDSNGDRGFIILDIDNNVDKAEKVSELIRRNENSAVKFIVSNPTFEIWILLHYLYTTRFFVDGNAVIRELKKKIPNYEKNKDCYKECIDKLDEALKNAKRLIDYYGEIAWPSIECNPRTDVGDLIKLLQE